SQVPEPGCGPSRHGRDVSEIFKQPSTSFKPKHPSGFSNKFSSSYPPSDGLTRKIPATCSQSETFPRQTRATPTQLHVYPRKCTSPKSSPPVASSTARQSTCDVREKTPAAAVLDTSRLASHGTTTASQCVENKQDLEEELTRLRLANEMLRDNLLSKNGE
ncbi:hypothetical protein L9F63_022773, partial [Diploptera punctata]